MTLKPITHIRRATILALAMSLFLGPARAYGEGQPPPAAPALLAALEARVPAPAAADPAAAPTLSSTSSGSSLAAGAYTVGYVWRTATGTTKLSPTSVATVNAGQKIEVTLPAFPADVTSADVYMSTAANSTRLALATTTTTTTVTLTSLPAPASGPPPPDARGDDSQQGQKGYQGQSGEQGHSGQAGEQATFGQAGAEGQSAQSGNQGQSGESGDQGPSNQMGDQGQSGQTDDQGTAGESAAEAHHEVLVTGELAAIDSAARYLTLDMEHGTLLILVTDQTVFHAGDMVLTFADLKIGQRLDAEGNLTANGLIASRVEVHRAEAGFVRTVGILSALGATSLTVTPEGGAAVTFKRTADT